MDKLSAFLHRRASWLRLISAFILYVMLQSYVLPRAEQAINRDAGQAVGIIDLGIGFDLEKMHQQVAAYGEAGRARYRRTELTADVVYPLAYAFFYAYALSMLMRGMSLSPGLQRANVLPFAAMGFDYLENIFLVTMLSRYPDWSETIALLCATFRMLKWATFAGIIGLMLFLIGKKIIKR